MDMGGLPRLGKADGVLSRRQGQLHKFKLRVLRSFPMTRPQTKDSGYRPIQIISSCTRRHAVSFLFVRPTGQRIGLTRSNDWSMAKVPMWSPRYGKASRIVQSERLSTLLGLTGRSRLALFGCPPTGTIPSCNVNSTLRLKSTCI